MILEHNDMCSTVNMKDPVERAHAPARMQAEMVRSRRTLFTPGDSFYFEEKEARSPDEGGGTGVAS